MGAYKEPHGGTLRELYLTESAAEKEKAAARDYPNWNLTARQLCDLELLLNGAFSPLDGFLNRGDYEAVLDGHAAALRHRLADPDQPRREPRVRGRAQGRRSHRAARSRGRADRDDGGRRPLGARQDR